MQRHLLQIFHKELVNTHKLILFITSSFGKIDEDDYCAI